MSGLNEIKMSNKKTKKKTKIKTKQNKLDLRPQNWLPLPNLVCGLLFNVITCINLQLLYSTFRADMRKKLTATSDNIDRQELSHVIQAS